MKTYSDWTIHGAHNIAHNILELKSKDTGICSLESHIIILVIYI